MHLPVRCLNMEKSIWSSENMNWSTDCISYSVNRKRNCFKCWEKKNWVYGNCLLGKVKSHWSWVFFKPSCSTLQLHFSKHAQMLLLLPLTCWSPAQTFTKWKKRHWKQEELERINSQGALPSHSSSPLWSTGTWVMLVHADWDPENNYIWLLEEKKKISRDTQNALFIKEHRLNPVILSPVPEQNLSSFIPVLCSCPFHSSVLL